MTGEEASFYLANMDRKDMEEGMSEALDMAIKALEQEPCEDAISRADVKKYLSAPNENGDRVIYESDLDLLPPVTPQPKTGHWIETDEWRETVDGFEQWGYFRKCNKCGYVFKFLEIDNFCPNCGCRMESEE